MKIAFVHKQASSNIPLGLGYLSAILKKEGYDVRFFDLKNGDDISILSDLDDYNPNIIGYGVISGDHKIYLNFNRKIKERFKKVVSIFGGPHTTFFPETIYEEGVDAICIGEAEIAFVDFVEKYQDQGFVPSGVPNFWVKVDGKIIKSSSLYPLITDLDSLPYPDREGYFMCNSSVKSYDIKQFSAHRGCPYNCTYCFNDAYNKLYSNKNILRSRSPKSICDEILSVKDKFPMKLVRFVDDAFTIKKAWILEFSREYSARVALPFSCNIRLNNVDEEIAMALEAAKCVLVHVGAESGNDYVRNVIMKRRMGKKLMLQNVELLHKHNIKVITENIIGNPGETYEMTLETLKLNQKIKPLLANCTFFTPYPKLPLTQYAIENHYFDGDFNKINDNYYSDTVIKFENPEDKNKLLNLRSFFSFLVKFPYLEAV